MKGCLQLNLLYGWKDFNLKLDLKLGPLDQQASASPTELLRLLTPILRIGDQVLTFDVFWPKHLQEVRSTVYIHVQSI